MPTQQERKALTHARIVKTAARAIRRSGYQGVGVADIMKEAGLTHGGFYAHFESRNALLVEAAEAASAQSAGSLHKAAQQAGPQGAMDAILDLYLGDAHVAATERGCPVAALGSEMGRQAPEVRAAATHGIENMAALLASYLPPDHKHAAFGTMSCMLGALVLARAVDDARLSAAIRASARDFIRTTR
ncbi:MAG: TetR/AcrR family transcriptional regulator [Herminiimonas sp.]|nr:TetR/AcrR family transcriptional regulator [Herminiimonas sp.]